MQADIIKMFEKFWMEFLKLLPSLLVATIVFLIFLLLSGKFGKLVKSRLIFRTNDVLLAGFFAKISKWIFVIIGFVIAMEILGLAILAGGIITGAGLSAVIIGFAFKNIGENFLSGLILAFNRPFKIGDTIQSENFTGTITSMDFRTTNIRTVDGHDVFIPNSMIINNPLINYTYDNLRRFDFTIQIDFTNDIDKAKSILTQSVTEVKDVLKDPKPIVTVDQLTTSASLKVYYWMDVRKSEKTIIEVKSEVLEFGRKKLNENGINITDVTQIRIMNDALSLKVSS